MAINPDRRIAELELGPAINISDTSNEAVLRASVTGDVYPRLELTAGGVIKTGAGSAAPTALLVANAAAQGSAYTQTYATSSKTVPAATAVAVATTAATNSTPYGYAQAQADAIVAAVNANSADILAVKKIVNALIDDLQALGLVL